MTTALAIHQIAVDKGFWDPNVRDPHFMSWCVRDHLLHAQAEVLEWLESDTIEEAADVCIVLLDLLGAQGLSVDLDDLLGEKCSNEYWRIIAKVYDQYRKRGVLDFEALLSIVQDLMDAYGEIALCEAVDAKCRQNKTRHKAYGVAK